MPEQTNQPDFVLADRLSRLDQTRTHLLAEADMWEGTQGLRAKRLREAAAALGRTSALIQSAYATRGGNNG